MQVAEVTSHVTVAPGMAAIGAHGDGMGAHRLGNDSVWKQES